MATRISTHRIVANLLAIAAALSTHAAAQTTRSPALPRELLLEARSELPAVTRPEHWARTREIAQWLAWAGFYDDALATTPMDTMFLSLAYNDLARIRAANGDVAGAIKMIDATLTGAAAARAKSGVGRDLAERGDFAQGMDVVRGFTGRALHDVQLAAADRQIT